MVFCSNAPPPFAIEYLIFFPFWLYLHVLFLSLAKLQEKISWRCVDSTILRKTIMIRLHLSPETRSESHTPSRHDSHIQTRHKSLFVFVLVKRSPPHLLFHIHLNMLLLYPLINTSANGLISPLTIASAFRAGVT